MTDPRAMPEFSRMLQLDAPQGGDADLRAEPDECAAIVDRLQLLGLSNLSVRAAWRRTSAGLIRLNVDFTANVVQSCVVSLEPVPALVTESFVVLCDGGQARTGQGEDEGEVFVDPFAEDPIEPLQDGQIDVGELVVQHLSLALEPYPKAPGVEVGAMIEDAKAAGVADVSGSVQGSDTENEDGPETEEDRPNPFAALAQLQAGGPNDDSSGAGAA